MSEEEIKENTENEEENQEGEAVFLRKVDVIIQNGENEQPIIIKAEEEDNK